MECQKGASEVCGVVTQHGGHFLSQCSAGYVGTAAQSGVIGVKAGRASLGPAAGAAVS